MFATEITRPGLDLLAHRDALAVALVVHPDARDDDAALLAHKWIGELDLDERFELLAELLVESLNSRAAAIRAL